MKLSVFFGAVMIVAGMFFCGMYLSAPVKTASVPAVIVGVLGYFVWNPGVKGVAVSVWSGVAALAVGFFVGFGVYSEPSPQMHEAFAVEYCRQRAASDAEGDANMERLLLGACDRLEEDYLIRYGSEP